MVHLFVIHNNMFLFNILAVEYNKMFVIVHVQQNSMYALMLHIV